MPNDADLEMEVLAFLETSNTPIGSGAIQLHLMAGGVKVSQPTIGRLLKMLDYQGFSSKASNKGRVLTKRGRLHIEELRRTDRRSRLAEEMLTAAEPASLGELRDVLVARRALEREIARLAAQHATENQIAEMQRTLDIQQQKLASGKTAADEALRFHMLLAEASANRFLATAANFIRNDKRSLEVVMYQLGSTVGGDSYGSHRAILNTVVNEDSDAAEEAMVAHMDQYIFYVESLQNPSLPLTATRQSLTARASRYVVRSRERR